ncbi:sensor histidine kinase [Pedobacter sp. HMF7647]|uniref:histidine kinase n=1 Tax=Hufsiella arboris TaxID=2695275 RepID=A0A7K1YF24_9SPHI|nr:HAMP domain-containing sensor histidine kinase [Hufsiella arboris]MXV53182.1 sensor histidine kinase [Hufsiella arboris]
MVAVVKISLENDMDLVLAHKRSMKVAEKLGLTTATQTTFATAVSEVARTVIDHTNHGTLEIGIEHQAQRHSLVASVTYDHEVSFTNSDAGFFYAQKLVPEFSLDNTAGLNRIIMKIGIPRFLKLDNVKIKALKIYFEQEGPINAYEEIKQRNISLNKLANDQEEELRQSRIIDEKKTEFISIASHEIKTPITIIKAYTQIAKSLKGGCSDQVKEILVKVDGQTNKLLSLVQQLLDISKIENGSLQYAREPMEFNSFISEVVEVIKHIHPHHTLITHLTDNIPVYIDRLRMEQVFSNLIGNAAKYSEKNTQITIKLTQEDSSARVTVTDEGIGMSDITMASIFDKFYRDKDVIQTHSGLGMGLYVASKIISDHGGTISVESVEKNGTTFTFDIPVTSGELS